MKDGEVDDGVLIAAERAEEMHHRSRQGRCGCLPWQERSTETQLGPEAMQLREAMLSSPIKSSEVKRIEM